MQQNVSIKLGEAEVARMGLGTNRLTNTPENQAFIRGVVEAGIGVIDSAHLYTGGESERSIGAALSSLPDSTVVATKGGFRPGEGRPEVLREQIEQSLRSLGTDRIPLYYLHRVDPETPLETSLRVIRDFVDRGQIGLVGISEVSIADIERARAVVPIAAVQNEYNLSVRKHDEVVDYCEREGIVFVPFYPLKGDHPALATIAEARSVTRSQVALAWLLRRSALMLPIPGTLSLAHARENLATLDIELTEEEFAALG
jgi:aryl-alcohol dehydrogenase-like predicted oxidoreductase